MVDLILDLGELYIGIIEFFVDLILRFGEVKNYG